MVLKLFGCSTLGSSWKRVILYMIVVLKMMLGSKRQMEHPLLVSFLCTLILLHFVPFSFCFGVASALSTPIHSGNVWPGPCVFPDYTQSKVRAWWANLVKDFISNGVDGIWNDMNEPAIFKVILISLICFLKWQTRFDMDFMICDCWCVPFPICFTLFFSRL